MQQSQHLRVRLPLKITANVLFNIAECFTQDSKLVFKRLVPQTGPYNYTTQTGVLMSPNYPQYYDNNQNVMYYIIVPAPSTTVVMNFNTLDLGSGDTLTAYDGPSITSTVIGA